MDDNELITALNARRPAFIELLGGKIVAVDPATKSCTFVFAISTQFCHSVDVVQGGFITTMLNYYKKYSPLPRDLEAMQVGHTAAFLASPLASAITGSTVYVDNGYHGMGMASPQEGEL